MANVPERRRSRRLALPVPCVIEQASGKGVACMLADIGLHGARLRPPRAFEPGARLTLNLTLGGEHFEEVPATVVWGRPYADGYECGVSFPDSWAGRIREALLHPRKQSVLVVEDDLAVRNGLARHLASAGYLPSETDGVAAARRMFEERAFDLVIVDLTLPDGSGMALLEAIRKHPKRSSTPVIILTADARLESKLAGLAIGADQYLTKPIDPVELLFCASALLRRTAYSEQAHGVLHFELGQIDPSAHVVRLGNREIANLTRKEFDLLYRLIAARPRVLSRQYILAKLWHTVLTDNAVETHIKNLRAKLGPEGAVRIVTVSGKGYKFV